MMVIIIGPASRSYCVFCEIKREMCRTVPACSWWSRLVLLFTRRPGLGGGGAALLDRGGRKQESSPVRSCSQGRGAATEEARGEQLEKHCLLNSALTSVGGQSGDEMVGRGFLKEDVAAWRLR